MPDLDIAEDSVTIVVRGHFNAAIPTPAWLLAQGLVGAEDALAVQADLMVPQISAYQLPWAKVEVTEDRFLVHTADPQHFERCRDLVVGIFSILSHTPVNALGINRSFHVRMTSANAWHALGDLLVPKGPWEGIMHLPGVAGLQMQGVRTDDFGGQIVCRFEPSSGYKEGIFLSYNDHYTLDVGVKQPATRHEFTPERVVVIEPSSERLAIALSILSKNWEESLSRANATLRSLAVRRAGV